MKSLVTMLAALAVAAPVYAQTAGQQQQQAEPPATETKAEAPSIAGKWNVTTTTDQGSMYSTLDIKVDEKDPKKITGTLVSDMGTAPIEGEWAEGKLGFALSMDTGGGAMQLWFAATMKEDGSLAGTIDFGQGTIPWTAVRPKN